MSLAVALIGCQLALPLLTAFWLAQPLACLPAGASLATGTRVRLLPQKSLRHNHKYFLLYKQRGVSA
jgi:hypothetical protein